MKENIANIIILVRFTVIIADNSDLIQMDIPIKPIIEFWVVGQGGPLFVTLSN